MEINSNNNIIGKIKLCIVEMKKNIIKKIQLYNIDIKVKMKKKKDEKKKIYI